MSDTHTSCSDLLGSCQGYEETDKCFFKCIKILHYGERQMYKVIEHCMIMGSTMVLCEVKLEYLNGLFSGLD